MPILQQLYKLGSLLLRRLGLRLLPASQAGVDLSADLVRICGQHAKVIFDVGSYEGESVAVLRSAFADALIYGFEPYAPAYATAQARHARDSRVQLSAAALGARQGQQTMYCYRGSAANALLAPSDEVGRYDYEQFVELVGEQPVQVQTLDAFCRERGIEAIDLLKIDTQGYEAQVLQGAVALLQSRAITAIVVEMLCVPYYREQVFFDQLYALLVSYGYRLVGLYYPTRSPSMAIDCCVGLFCRA